MVTHTKQPSIIKDITGYDTFKFARHYNHTPLPIHTKPLQYKRDITGYDTLKSAKHPPYKHAPLLIHSKGHQNKAIKRVPNQVEAGEAGKQEARLAGTEHREIRQTLNTRRQKNNDEERTFADINVSTNLTLVPLPPSSLASLIISLLHSLSPYFHRALSLLTIFFPVSPSLPLSSFASSSLSTPLYSPPSSSSPL